MKLPFKIAGICIVLLSLNHVALAQQPSIPERVAALKTSIAFSEVSLKQYQWIETTIVSVKGEEKSRKQEQCFYGADGKLTKIEIEETPEPAPRRGIIGRIVERKKEELTDYMKNAVSLVKTYVPPNPAKIEAAKEAGKVSIDILEPGKRIRLNFKDYEKPGDTFGIEVDMVANRLLGMKVATYLDDAKDAVTLDVRMGVLNDGNTTYASEITLDAKAKELKVTVQNSGYRKTN